MKQFLTLCFASAMLGSALSAGANVTIRKSLESRSEGMAVYSPIKTPDSRSLGTVRHIPSSPFQKIMLGKTAKTADAKKVAAKVTAQDDPEQPKRPEAGAADFNKNNQIGFVSFTMPAEMADGAPIEGTVGYRTYVDGELYGTGSAEAGAVVKVNFAVSEGLHTFGMTAEINGVESSMATVRAYVGNDDPLMPGNVTLDSNEINWTAVGPEGVHGGYVDVSAMEYDVYLNGELLNRTAKTSQAINIDKDADLQTYTAMVVAVCNGHESEPAFSNTIVEGSACSIPLYIEPTPEEFLISVVLDGNGDGKSWTLEQIDGDAYCINSGCNATEVSDEWYFLPPVMVDDPSKFYTFSMEAALISNQYTDENVEVLLCNRPDKSGVVDQIIPEFSPASAVYEYARGEFRVRQAGTYYVAIHAASEPDQMGVRVRNMSIVDNKITVDSPEAVDDLDLEAGEDGKLEATATFTLPTMALGGGELPAGAQLVATLSCGDNTASVSGLPGEEVSATIATSQGDNIVTVAVSMGYINSPAASKTVYTGVWVPRDVESVSSVISDDNCSITLTWPAVTEAQDPAGYVNPETVLYDIYKYVSEDGYYGDWVLYEPNITETTYEYTADRQELLMIGVVAHNEAGNNGNLIYTTAVVGPAYELPMYEDFEVAGSQFKYDPWVIRTPEDGLAANFSFYKVSNLSEDYADGETVVMTVRGEAGALSQLCTPVFKTTGMESAAITFEVCGDFELPDVKVIAAAVGVEAEEIGQVNTDERGFHKVSVALPEKFLGKEVVSLNIQFEFATGDEVFAIESLEIGSCSGVASVEADGVKIAAGRNVINVSGLNGRSVTVATLDGRVAARAENAGDDVSFRVESGIYVVSAGGRKTKVVVK